MVTVATVIQYTVVIWTVICIIFGELNNEQTEYIIIIFSYYVGQPLAWPDRQKAEN